MDRLEHLYLLNASQLQLLLALTSERPVPVLGLAVQPTADRELWEQSALALFKEGWLCRTQQGLEPDGTLGEALRLLCDAPCSETIFCRRGPSTAKQLFRSGARATLLELYGEQGYRLQLMTAPDLARWEDLLGLLPCGGEVPDPPGALASQAPAFNGPALAWGTDGRAVTVSDLYDGRGELKRRRVFLTGDGLAAILEQDEKGVRLSADTLDQRLRIFAQGQKGETSI